MILISADNQPIADSIPEIFRFSSFKADKGNFWKVRWVFLKKLSKKRRHDIFISIDRTKNYQGWCVVMHMCFNTKILHKKCVLCWRFLRISTQRYQCGRFLRQITRLSWSLANFFYSNRHFLTIPHKRWPVLSFLTMFGSKQWNFQ